MDACARPLRGPALPRYSAYWPAPSLAAACQYSSNWKPSVFQLMFDAICMREHTTDVQESSFFHTASHNKPNLKQVLVYDKFTYGETVST